WGLGGNDDIEIAGSISKESFIYGGKGNDRLKGGAGNDVLLGEDGDDNLLAGGGRDLMIGGDGADQLGGNSGDNIMIGGTTSLNDMALCAIIKEWGRTDHT